MGLTDGLGRDIEAVVAGWERVVVVVVEVIVVAVVGWM